MSSGQQQRTTWPHRRREGYATVLLGPISPVLSMSKNLPLKCLKTSLIFYFRRQMKGTCRSAKRRRPEDPRSPRDLSDFSPILYVLPFYTCSPPPNFNYAIVYDVINMAIVIIIFTRLVTLTLTLEAENHAWNFLWNIGDAFSLCLWKRYRRSRVGEGSSWIAGYPNFCTSLVPKPISHCSLQPFFGVRGLQNT